MVERFITDVYDGYEVKYPFLIEHVKTQLEKQFWTATEAKVELDEIELRHVLTPEQQHVVKRLLPLFLKYELYVGSFWTDVYCKLFPAPEAVDAGVTVAMVERAIHARFYDKINAAFGLNNDDFYLSYLNDPAYTERVKWIGEVLSSNDKVKTCCAFGLIEASALFSAFALLRSFQANGYNLISVVVRGTKQSALDEKLHSKILADTLNVMFKEKGVSIDDTDYIDWLLEMAQKMYLNEEHIIDSLIGEEFNKVSKSEYKKFVRCCINDYFVRIGSAIKPFPDDQQSDLYEWFDMQNESYSDPDFFTKGQNKEYEIACDEDAFGSVWFDLKEGV